MAIYHLSAQALSRARGASSVAAAAYRSGGDLVDRRTGERHDYSRRGGVDATEIVAPDEAPDWARSRAELWNAAEAAERRKNSQVAREVRVAIPSELGREEGRKLVREFAREQFAARGMVADIAWHGAGGDNPHAHILLTMRRIEGEGFSRRKERAWNAKTTLQEWRQGWEQAANRALERAGSAERIDHRTLAAQREEALARGDLDAAGDLDRAAGVHMGKAATHMEAKGIETERGTRHLEIDDHNRELQRNRGQSRLLELVRQRLQQLRDWSRRLAALERRLLLQARQLGLQRRQPAGAGRGRQRGRRQEPSR